MLFIRTNQMGETGSGSDYWDQTHDLRFEVGRYWTPHVKTEIGVSAPNRWDRGVSIPVEGVPYAYAQRTQQVTFVTPALTYQFYENQFAHPYVSVGTRLAFGTSHTFREESSATVKGIRYPIPRLDERSTIAAVRPFLAIGAKSYFDSRTYVRSEAMLAYGSARLVQFTLRLGVGVDF